MNLIPIDINERFTNYRVDGLWVYRRQGRGAYPELRDGDVIQTLAYKEWSDQEYGRILLEHGHEWECPRVHISGILLTGRYRGTGEWMSLQPEQLSPYHGKRVQPMPVIWEHRRYRFPYYFGYCIDPKWNPKHKHAIWTLHGRAERFPLHPEIKMVFHPSARDGLGGYIRLSEMTVTEQASLKQWLENSPTDPLTHAITNAIRKLS